MAQVHELLTKVKQEVGVVGKDGYNQAQRFNFRSIDGIYNAVHPIFSRHGLVTLPKVTRATHEKYETAKGTVMFNARLIVEYHIIAPDGSTVVCSSAGEGSDAGDKATSKAMAMAHKYALIQMLQLQTEDEDPDAQIAPPPRSHREEPRRPAGPPADEPPAKGQDLSEVRKKLGESLQQWVNGDKVKAKDIIAFLLPGMTSVSKLADDQVRRYSLAWWYYRLMNGKEEDIKENLRLVGMPWFDKMDNDQLDKLKGYCKEEARQQDEFEKRKMSPSTKDENGEDPF